MSSIEIEKCYTRSGYCIRTYYTFVRKFIHFTIKFKWVLLENLKWNKQKQYFNTWIMRVKAYHNLKWETLAIIYPHNTINSVCGWLFVHIIIFLSCDYGIIYVYKQRKIWNLQNLNDQISNPEPMPHHWLEKLSVRKINWMYGVRTFKIICILTTTLYFKYFQLQQFNPISTRLFWAVQN